MKKCTDDISISSLRSQPEGSQGFNSNLDDVDDAFKCMINKSQKGEKGQYFTPRYVCENAQSIEA